MRNIVFGDTGGHFRQLHKSLLEIGMTEDYFLPEDVRIIHLGDLVHKGLYSSDILRMIDEIRILNPEQWIQLIGNHEAQYLGGYVFWDKRVDEPGRKILAKWYEEGFLKFVYSLTPKNNLNLVMKTVKKDYVTSKPIVFSHAGLSFPFWSNYLKNIKVSDFEKAFDTFSIRQVHKSGLMLGENFDVYSPVGPIWAHGVHEVWILWKIMVNEGLNSSFSQIVGHIAPYQYGRKSYFPGTHEMFKNAAELNESERFTVAPLAENNNLNNTWMGFMDPGYAKNADTEVQPYLTIVSE